MFGWVGKSITVKKVVTDGYYNSKRCQNIIIKENKRREQYHARTDSPYNLQEEKTKMNIETPAEIKYSNFCYDQP